MTVIKQYNVGTSSWETVVIGAQGAQGPTGPQGPTADPVICTSSTRPSSPIVGQTIYETDTGRYLVYYGATTLWQPPWALPWGYVAQTATPPTTVQTISATTSTKITNTDTASCTIRSDRRYRYTAFAYYSHTVSSSFCYLGVFTSTGIALGPSWTQVLDAGSRQIVMWVAYASGTSFTGTIQLNAQQLAGTLEVNLTNYGARVLVEDVGPVSYSPPSP